MGEFETQYKNYRWFYLLENPQVKDFVASYNNKHTRRLAAKTIDIFVREMRKDNPDFDISQFLSLNPVKARKVLWSMVQRIMSTRGKSNLTAKQVKSFLSLLYNETNEETGKVITWKRKHRISTIQVRKKKVPTHEEVWQLIDYSIHTRDKALIALSYCTGLKAEALSNLNISDLKPLLEDFKINQTEPLILKITPRIYPKRFTSLNGSIPYHNALICRDASDLLLQYYEEKRKDASDDEPFFVTTKGKRLGVSRFSNQIEYLVSKLDKQIGGNRKNIRASLLRDAFYNRLISGKMQDAYRETLMMHSSIRSHYFNWETEKENIIRDYNKCKFNRTTENNEMRKRVKEQQAELEHLRKQLKEQQKTIDLLKDFDVRELLKKVQEM